jgi:hypothetical protein
MENTIMSVAQLVDHVMWSLDITSEIEVREDAFDASHHTDFLALDSEDIHAHKVTFKEVSPEGFISSWYRDYPFTKGYILVTERVYRKDFYTGEETFEEFNKLFRVH